MGQLRVEPGERFTEHSQLFEQADDVAADAGWRTEVDDFHRDAPANAIEAADALFHHRRLPRQVEQHQAPAELEVAALAAAFGGHQQAGAIDLTKARHFGVTTRRGELFMKHARGQVRAIAERRAKHLQRLAMRHEDEGLFLGGSPERCVRDQPLDAGIGGVHRLDLRPQRVVGSEHGAERRARRERPTHAIDFLARHDGIRRGRASHRLLDRAAQLRTLGIEKLDRNAHSRGQATDVGPASRAGAGGKGCALREAGFEAGVLRKLPRTQQLQQPEEPMRIVFERRGAQQQHVAAQGRNGRDGAPGRLAGMARRTPKSLRLVHHQQVDAGLHGLLGEVRPCDQHLERDHGAAMQFEGIEVVAKVARHVAEALGVEQGEHLVILAPQFTQPLHREGLRRHHQATPHLAGVHQPVEDQRGLDRLAETHFVGEQPPHRIGSARALGHMELVGKQPHPSAQE